MKNIVLALFIATAILAADQASKWWVLSYFMNHGPTEITPFFNLALVWNKGISFGMFAQHDQPLLLIITSTIITAILIYWLFKNQFRMVAVGIGIVIGGAVGNIIDRARFGAVVDFLDFHAFGYHWPAFNIADASIFIGVVVLCIHSMFFEPKNPKDGL